MKYFTFLLLLCQLSVAAQIPDLEKDVRLIFGEGTELKWLRSFKGRVDDVNDVAIVLGFDGYACKGKMVYLRSKESFKLDGGWDNGQFQLQEVDTSGKVSGELHGKVTSNFMEATWSNVGNNIGRRLMLIEVDKVDDLPTHCGDNKWYGVYASDETTPELEMILQKSSSNQVSGIIYLNGRSFKAHGEINNRNQLVLVLRKSSGIVLGNLTADYRNIKSLNASILYEDNRRQDFPLALLDQFAVDCVEYADYVTSYDFTFPKTKNAAFNNWIENKAQEWITASRNQVKKAKSFQQVPELRASGRAYGWCEVEFYTENIISGFFTCQTSWNSDDYSMAFNFDLKKGEEIKHKDLFKDSFNASYFVRNFVKTAFKNHSLYESDPDFKKWIDGAEFPHFTIRKEGICFSTAFNVMYGRQSLTVPFLELKGYLKDNSVVKSLIDK